MITDVATDSFCGLRRFLDHAVAAGLVGPVKWQFVGPVTLGVALDPCRAGRRRGVRRRGAGGAVARRVAVGDGRRGAAPRRRRSSSSTSRGSANCSSPGFPIAPDPAIDLLSGAMASVSGVATVGVHCCGDADVASLLAAGPDVLSIPARPAVAGAAGYLGRFLEAAGASPGASSPPTDRCSSRPIASGASWSSCGRRSSNGASTATLLRRRSLVTAHCGLGLHTPVVAERVCRAVREIGRRIAVSACEDRYP